jgi:hypothetical protein
MDRKTIDVVQELLAAEQASIVLRLAESTVFISPLSTRQASAIRRIAADITEHSASLVDLLTSAGRSPGPRIAYLNTADLHFQEISAALPRVAADLTHLTHLCERAAQRTTDPAVAAVIARMTDRHRKHLETLRGFDAPATEAPQPVLADHAEPSPSDAPK